MPNERHDSLVEPSIFEHTMWQKCRDNHRLNQRTPLFRFPGGRCCDRNKILFEHLSGKHRFR
jgi:hypothetical protein